MFALTPGDLDLTFNSTGYNITGVTSDRDQFSTTMGIFPPPFPNYTVMGGYRDVPKTSGRIDNPADLELIFLDENGKLLPFGPNKDGSVTAQVGLGDSRIAGLDFQILNNTLYIVTAGYTVVSGSDLEYFVDDSNPISRHAVRALPSRRFREEDIGATLEIVGGGSPWLTSKYLIVSVNEEAGIAYLNKAPTLQNKPATNGKWTLNGSTDMLVSRFVYTGDDVILDTSFGRNGHHIIPVAHGVYNYDYAYAIVTDHYSEIYVAGYSQSADVGDWDMTVARLRASDGGLVTGFGDPESLITWKDAHSARGGRRMINVDLEHASADFANTIDLQGNGDIIIAGSSNAQGPAYPTFVRLTNMGLLVESFGRGGIVVVPLETSTQSARPGFVNCIDLYSNGNIIATGTVTTATRDTFILRLKGSDGSLDLTFGDRGIVIDNLSPGRHDWGNGVVLQPSESGHPGGSPSAGDMANIVIVGSIEIIGQKHNIYVARYLGDGRQDKSFYKRKDTGLHVHIIDEIQGGNPVREDYGAAVELDQNKKIVFSGSTDSRKSKFDMVGIRLVTNPPLGPASKVNAISCDIVENDAGLLDVAIKLVLTAATSAPVTVQYTTEDGTAIAGVGYVAKQGSVTFAPGTTQQTVNAQIIGNTDYQPNRKFLLKIVKVTGAEVGTADAVITIRDNDRAWQNLAMPEDVDADGLVVPQDVLWLVDEFQSNGARQLTAAMTVPNLWIDVTGDTLFTPVDILTVLDAVNRQSHVGGSLAASGESSSAVMAGTTQARMASDAAIATGLAQPVHARMEATDSILVEPSEVSAGLISPPAAPSSQVDAIDRVLADWEYAAASEDAEETEDLYELISSDA